MSKDETKYWFAAKKHGWGWGLPSAWQGWVAWAAYLVLVALGLLELSAGLNLALFLVYLLGLSALFLALCWWKGEPPRWR